MSKKATAAIEKNLEQINNKLLLLEDRLNQSTNTYQLDAANDQRFSYYKNQKDAEIQEAMEKQHRELMEALKIHTNELVDRWFECKMSTTDFSQHVSLKYEFERLRTLIDSKPTENQITRTNLKIKEVEVNQHHSSNLLNTTVDRLGNTESKIDAVIETQSALPGAISKVMHEKITQYADAIYQNLTAQLEEKLTEMDSCYKKNKTVDIDTMKMDIYRKVKTDITEGIKPIDEAVKSLSAEHLVIQADVQDLLTKWSNLTREISTITKSMSTHRNELNNLNTNLARIDNTERDHFTTVTTSIAELVRLQKRCVITDAGTTYIDGWISPLRTELRELQKNYERLYHEINRTQDTQMDIVKAIMESTKTYFDTDGDVAESEDERKDEEVMVIEDVDNPALKAEVEQEPPKPASEDDKMKKIKKILLRIDKAKVNIPDYIAASDRIPVPSKQEPNAAPEPITVIDDPNVVEPKHKESCTMKECVGCGLVMHLTVYEYLMRICDEILVDVSVKSFKDPVNFCSKLIYCTEKISFHLLLQREATKELGRGCNIKEVPSFMKTEGNGWFFVEGLRNLILEQIPMPKLQTLNQVDSFMSTNYKENKLIAKAWLWFHAMCSHFCGGNQRYEYTHPPHIFDTVMIEASAGLDRWKSGPIPGLQSLSNVVNQESKPLEISLSAGTTATEKTRHQYRGLMYAAVTECFRRVCMACGIDYSSMQYDILGTNRLLTLGDRLYNTLKYQATRANLAQANLVVDNLRVLANTHGHIIDICNFLMNAEIRTLCTSFAAFVADLDDHGVNDEYIKNIAGFISVYNFYKPPMSHSILIPCNRM